MKMTITVDGDTYEDRVEFNQFFRCKEISYNLSKIREALFYVLDQDFNEWSEVQSALEELLDDTYIEGIT